MNKLLALLFTLLLGLATAQTGSLGEDARFDEVVPLVTQNGGESLQSMVEALALSVGLTPIVNEVPADQEVYYGIDNPIPFRQIWNLVMADNALDYVLLENDVIFVGSSAAVADFRAQNGAGQQAASNPDAEILLRFYRVNNDPVEVADLVSQAVPNIEVTGNANIEVISVRGTQEQQDEVELVLGQFDSPVDQEPLQQRVYNLSYSSAEELAQVLQDSGISNEVTNAEGDTQTDTGDFRVVADTGSNSLIVTATAAVQARVAEIIPQLDVAQSQINVQVRIQEISSSAEERLGLNLSAGLGNFTTNILDGGLNFVFNAQQALSGLHVGAVLDTLENQNLARRVDDTNLTVTNNKPAIMQSGGTIYVSIASGDSPITREIEYGVVVTIVPRITADGRITMDIEAEVSEPDGDIEDPQIFEVIRNRAQSTITTESGQTVLLGGLFQNRFNTDTTGVPILSSIPIIGSVFTDTATTESNTELLLIVNANIVE